jgi:DNA topoisomerase-2
LEFTVETADSRKKKKYKQTWTQNMSKKGKEKITDYKGDDYTKVTFKPDYARFSMEGMDDDFEALVKRRIYDLAGTVKGVKVKLNGDMIKIKKFSKYMEMYTKALEKEAAGGEEGAEKQTLIVDNPHERWEVGFAVSDGSFKQVSFVNNIATTSGGTHVKYVADQIITKLLEVIKKKNKKGVTLKPHQIQSHMFLFINCQIVNPAFTSQTKEQLTTKASQFGSKFNVSDKFLSQIEKSPIIANIMDFAERKADQLLAKSDGSKRSRMNNAKLTDANKAGTRDGWKCTLILTEGESASGLALAGRAVADPDLIGVFPLRGKLLNVRDASVAQISNNSEIQNIKKFMGLQHKKEYTDTKGLRYGQLMIMTDQDHDGSHIKGLLVNFLETHYPSLLRIPNFLSVFITPIVKVWKGDPKYPKFEKSFFTMPEYINWKQEPGHQKGWDHKYYKGLGTSTNEDAQIYFRDPDKHLKLFHPMKQEEHQLIDLAFSKKKADARKNWLREFVPGTFLDMSVKEISYDDFVNKELILFSMADNLRSIPSVVDGLKPTQRKVLYTCFNRNMKKDMKVVELAGIVSGSTAYAYGDTSMQQTIVGLAQDFLGSNNVNLLEPSGNFGSRRMGGADAAAARYIYTRPTPFARRIFNKADDALLKYDEDDGKQIEPLTYVPILPLILLNGASGIGTGWSTNIPNYSPIDIIENLKIRMNGTKEDMKPMQPWFKDFKGEVQQIGPDKYKFSGIVAKTGENEIEITELPVRMWTQDFKDKLEDIIKAEKEPSWIKDYLEYNTPTTVHFIIKMDEKHMKIAMEKGLEERFKLSSTMTTSNMVAFDGQGRIQRYETALDIMEEFYHIRLKFYEKRRVSIVLLVLIRNMLTLYSKTCSTSSKGSLTG